MLTPKTYKLHPTIIVAIKDKANNNGINSSDVVRFYINKGILDHHGKITKAMMYQSEEDVLAKIN